MSRLIRDLQLVDARGRKYLAADECQRFLEVASIRIRTPKRRTERWREVPVPPELLRALELVHARRSTPAKAAGKPLWPWSPATAHRRIARIMAEAGIEGPLACPKGNRLGFRFAAVSVGVQLPRIAAALGHANTCRPPRSTPPPRCRSRAKGPSGMPEIP